jgi:hypothetical protein
MARPAIGCDDHQGPYSLKITSARDGAVRSQEQIAAPAGFRGTLQLYNRYALQYPYEIAGAALRLASARRAWWHRQ